MKYHIVSIIIAFCISIVFSARMTIAAPIVLDGNCLFQGAQVGGHMSGGGVIDTIVGALGQGAWNQGVKCVNSQSELENTKISTIVTAIMRGILVIVGILAVASFVIAGILYLVSGGVDEQITRAKRALRYGIIGTIIALAGLIIITAVERVLSGRSDF